MKWPKLEGGSIHHAEQIDQNVPSSSSAKKIVKRNNVAQQGQLQVAHFLDELSIGLTNGIDGYDYDHSPTLWLRVRGPIFFALANNHDSFCALPFSNAPLTLTETGTNVKMDFHGETRTLYDTSIQQIKFLLCRELFHSATEATKDLHAFTWNVGYFGKNFTIDFERFTRQTDYRLPHMAMHDERYIRELNCKVPRPVPGKNFTCGHFVIQLFRQYLLGNVGMRGIHWQNFGSRELIAQTMPETIEEDFQTVIHNAKSYALIKNDLFGAHVDACFEKMEQQNAKFMLLMILSTTHVMGCILEIQQTEDGNSERGMEFYNPQHTNITVSCRPSDPKLLRTQTLKLFINGTGQGGQDYYGTYFPGSAPICMVMEIDAASFIANAALNNKRFLPIPSDQLTVDHMYYLFMLGFQEQVENLLPQLRAIGERSPNELFALLRAPSENGTPWLHNALGKNCVASIRALKTLILSLKDLIPENKLIELLAANGPDGTPGIYYALKKGYLPSICLFNELVALVSDKTLLTNLMSSQSPSMELLLTRTNEDGEPLLHLLFKNGDHETLKTIQYLFPGLAQYISAPVLANIIAAKNDNGESGIAFAIEKGDAKTIAIYEELAKFA